MVPLLIVIETKIGNVRKVISVADLLRASFHQSQHGRQFQLYDPAWNTEETISKVYMVYEKVVDIYDLDQDEDVKALLHMRAKLYAEKDALDAGIQS